MEKSEKEKKESAFPSPTPTLSTPRDTLFSSPPQKQFEFDRQVAGVFDDMIQRSVPFYWENLKLQISLLKRFLQPGDRVVDLGCSTGNFLLQLGKGVEGLQLVGIDNSPPMIERAKIKGEAMGVKIEWIAGDFLTLPLPKSRVIVANYTLQFVRPLKREKLVKKIFDALTPGGMVIVTEKIISGNSWLDRAMVEIYYDFKREMGYSDYEIARKREALENVLIPYTAQENRELLESVGFRQIETLFRWNNFATFIGFKPLKKEEGEG